MANNYTKTFDNKKQAHAYYHALTRAKNIASCSVCYNVMRKCYEVEYTRKNKD